MRKPIAIVLITLLVLLLGWHLFATLFTSAVIITGSIWGFLVATVIGLSIAILLLFILASSGILIVGLISFVWTLVAVVLFPVVLPVVLPLFLIFLFLSYNRSQQKAKAKKVAAEDEETTVSSNSCKLP